MFKIWKHYKSGNNHIIPYSTRLMSHYFSVRFYWDETWVYKLFEPVSLFEIKSNYCKEYNSRLRDFKLYYLKVKYNIL